MKEPVELKAGEVAQVDREAANALWHNVTSSGDIDDIARAFARHRLSHSAPPHESTREMVEAGRTLLTKLDEMLPEAGKRPTIAELEAILAAGNSGAIELKPDGSIHVAPRAEIEAFRAALDAAPQANSLAVGEEERAEAIALLTKWLKDTPRYAGDEPRAMHYQQNVRALTVAIEALSRPAPSSDREATIEASLAIIDSGAQRLRNQGEDAIWRTGEMIVLHVGKIRAALAASPGAMAGAWQSLDSYERNGTMVWLAVDYSDSTGRDEEGCHPLADASIAATVGFNNFDHDGEDVWKFAGWCWSHDHYTEGRGTVIAWRPIGFELGLDDDAQVAALTPKEPTK